MPLIRDAARIAVLGAATAAVWGIGVERHLYTVRRHTAAVLPPGAAPLRVLHLSDLHMAPWQRRKQDWVAGLTDLSPDLVVNTGDNLGHPGALPGVVRALAPFRGVPGVFVHGSNDVWAPSPRNPLRYLSGPSARPPKERPLDTAALDRWLTDELGWADVDNATAALTAGGIRVAAFGVDDAHRGWDDLPTVAALRRLDAHPDDAEVTLGVTHAPYRRVLDAFTDLGADILFAGHTHGGQVRVPLVRRALVANCDLPLDQARGLSTWQHEGRRIPLNVSAGIGTSIYAPVRFGCRPEASLVTLIPSA